MIGKKSIFYSVDKDTFKCITLGRAYNEFGYKEHPAVTSRFLCIQIIDNNV